MATSTSLCAQPPALQFSSWREGTYLSDQPGDLSSCHLSPVVKRRQKNNLVGNSNRFCWSSNSECLGSGYTSTVHRGHDLLTGSSIAIKVVPKVKQRLLASDHYYREIYSRLPDLGHPNLLKIHGFLEDETNNYIITDLCMGPDLVDYVLEFDPGTVPIEISMSLIHQILCGLNKLHTSQILHRDVKLDNILFLDKNRKILNLIDFDMGLLQDVKEPPKKIGDHSQVSVVGTRDYMAPECYRGIYTTATDLWSVGVILYMLLDGHFPFNFSTTGKCHREIKDVLKRGVKISPQIRRKHPLAVNFLDQLMKIDHTERLQTTWDALAHPWLNPIQRPPSEKSKGGKPPSTPCPQLEDQSTGISDETDSIRTPGHLNTDESVSVEAVKERRNKKRNSSYHSTDSGPTSSSKYNTTSTLASASLQRQKINDKRKKVEKYEQVENRQAYDPYFQTPPPSRISQIPNTKILSVEKCSLPQFPPPHSRKGLQVLRSSVISSTEPSGRDNIPLPAFPTIQTATRARGQQPSRWTEEPTKENRYPSLAKDIHFKRDEVSHCFVGYSPPPSLHTYSTRRSSPRMQPSRRSFNCSHLEGYQRERRERATDIRVNGSRVPEMHTHAPVAAVRRVEVVRTPTAPQRLCIPRANTTNPHASNFNPWKLRSERKWPQDKP